MKHISCLLFLLLAACSSSSDSKQDLAAGDVPDTASPDATGETTPYPVDLIPEAVDLVPETPDLVAEVTPAFTPGGLPLALPFEYTRPDKGTPLSAEEIADVTTRLTGFWAQIDYFNWVYETCHGMDESTGFPDYLIWWHDVDAVKEGDTVTFRHNPAYGGSHNNAVPTAVVLLGAIGGYLSTGDQAMGRIVEQFVKSFTALQKGFVYDENDPIDFIVARNIISFNHEFVMPNGKKKAVDYTPWYFEYQGWNADRYNYPNNPTYGDVWVTTMRSKDDVPYIFRVAAWLPYIIELSDDDEIKQAAQEAYEYAVKFAKDIVDQGYFIRSKDKDGNAIIPDQDLASFVDFVDLIPDAECDARLASALMGYGEPLDNACGSGQGSLYDDVAGDMHYFNYAIVDHFHLAAIHLALVTKQDEMAKELLAGFATRVERYLDPNSGWLGQNDESWQRDIALLLLKGATLGLPLTSEEARLVQQFHAQAVDIYELFPNWDLWDPSVPDGTYDFRKGFHPAHTPEAIKIEDMVFILEYCWSPFKNPASARFVDCDTVNTVSTW
jgi:hypothetical protein